MGQLLQHLVVSAMSTAMQQLSRCQAHCLLCLPAGFFPTLLEDVPDMAVKFAAYESMRQLHKKLNDGRSASPQVRCANGFGWGIYFQHTRWQAQQRSQRGSCLLESVVHVPLLPCTFCHQ